MGTEDELLRCRGILEASWKRCLEDQKDFTTRGGGLRSGLSHCGVGLEEKGEEGLLR